VARAFAVKPYDWQPYTPGLLAELRTKEKPVLVEFTATWCVNCHTVEATVLNNKDIQAIVRGNGVRMVKADITDKNEPSYHFWKFDVKAVGVPLTLIYPPGGAEPISLVGIYDVDELRDALEQASAKKTAMR
jgi:thiol:disulfide interchange protein